MTGLDKLRRAWDAEAATFDEQPDHGLRDPHVREAWRRLLLDHLPVAPARVADLGCGTGSLSVLLAQEGYDVAGLDISGAMVAAAQQKAASSGVAEPDGAAGSGAGAGARRDRGTARFFVGDAAAPGLEPGSVDVVLSRHVLWALADPVAALGRWVDLLAPGGRLLLVEGSWSTGAGLTALETDAMVRRHRRSVTVQRLTAPELWGGAIDDERYLALSTA